MRLNPETAASPARWYAWFKRITDILGAGFALILLAPLIIVSALAVLLSVGWPLLFRQRRPGLKEQSFTCLKFRTMTEARDVHGSLLSEERRLTRVGAVLRRTSLDELPQLWNILRGDMSFVGPRPLLESYLPYYTVTEHRRHSVRPGLTGWAQIHGRHRTPFNERLAMDVWYVDNASMGLDLLILLKTIWILAANQGVTGDCLPRFDQLRSQSISLVSDITHGSDNQ